MNQTESALVLWDIDHTLLSIGSVSREIYERAFRSVVGRSLGELAPMAGRTERAILADTLTLNDVEPSEPTVSKFYQALGEAAHELTGRMHQLGKPLPGAYEAISQLQHKGIFQSVVTGNIHSIAVAKLTAFGLAGNIDLDTGGYGDDGSDRADLVRLARERSESKKRTTYAGRVFVIGDTPHDIKGAHGAGAVAVGVATGATPANQLAECGADLVLEDLTNPEELRKTVFGLLKQS